MIKEKARRGKGFVEEENREGRERKLVVRGGMRGK